MLKILAVVFSLVAITAAQAQNVQFRASPEGRFVRSNQFSRPPIIAFAGDSISDFAGGTKSSNSATAYNMDGISPFFWALGEQYWADIYLDGRSYANGGYNLAVGGTSSSDLQTTQLPQLTTLCGSVATCPDIVYVQTLQNDAYFTSAAADGFVANVTSFANAALALGVQLVIIGSAPPKTAGVGAGVVAAKAHANARLANFANTTPGVLFFDYNGAGVADPSGASENLASASQYVAWCGTDGTANGCSTDGTHPSSIATRYQANPSLALTNALKRIARPTFPRAELSQAFDGVNFPYMNVLGKNGLFQGNGGQYNGVNNTGVAGNSAAANDRWQLTDGNGIVATPSLTTDQNGFPAQRLTFSGTATAAATVTLSANFIVDVPSAQYTTEVLMAFSGVNNLNEFGWFCAGATVYSGTGNAASIANGFSSTMYLRSRRPVTFANSGSSTRTCTAQFTFRSGVTAAGSVIVSRAGIFREN